jgi:hypothetical protein
MPRQARENCRLKCVCMFSNFFLTVYIHTMGRVIHGASCPWGEMSMGRVVRGVSCPWGELSVGRDVRWARCPWDEMSVGRNVRGAKCPWGEMSVGRNDVGRVVVGRVLMGRVVRGASCPWGELSWGEWSGNLISPFAHFVSSIGEPCYVHVRYIASSTCGLC